MTKTQILKCLLLLVSFTLIAKEPYAAQPSKPVLRILNWSDFILLNDAIAAKEPIVKRSPLLSGFMQSRNCLIDYFEYDATLEMRRNITNLKGFYDVVVVSHGELPDLVKARMLYPLEKDRIPNLKYIIPNYLSLPTDPANTYSVPYLAGTTGIAVNRDFVGDQTINWHFYFHPPNHLKGKIGILGDPLVVFSIALQALGFDPNSSQENEIKAAGKLIYHLKKGGFIGLCSSDVGLIKQKMIHGELAMAILYSGDAMAAAAKSNRRIQYVIPEEGTEFYLDSFVIPAASNNKVLAHEFINYAIQPTMHTDSAIYLKYTCPNKRAAAIIQAKAPGLMSNPSIFLPKPVMQKLRVYNNTNYRIKRLWDKIFSP